MAERSQSNFKMMAMVVFVAVLSMLSIVRDTSTLRKYHGDDSILGNTTISHPRVTYSQSIPPAEQLINPKNIPSFMTNYFKWHRRQLEQMHDDEEKVAENGIRADDHDFLENYRFLVLRCAGNDRCGGLSDRLKAFPLFIWYAATTNRILFIRWGSDRPAPIETFMKPGNFWNWTVPDALMRKIKMLDENDNNNGNSRGRFTRLYFESGNKSGRKNMNRISDQSIWMVEGNEYSGGQYLYQRALSEALKGESSLSSENNRSPHTSDLFSASKLQPRDVDYKNFYHDLFHATFRPSSSVSKHLDAYFYNRADYTVDDNNGIGNKTLEETGDDALFSLASKSWLPIPLQRNQYAVAHYRAKYPGEPFRETQNRTVLRETTIHAVECAKTRVGHSRTQDNSQNNRHSSSVASERVSAVYMASDTALVVEAAREAYVSLNDSGSKDGDHEKASLNVWTYLDLQSYDTDYNIAASDGIGQIKTKNTIALAEDPPHLNFAKPDHLSTFYSIFVDLFLMSYSNCVVYGAGGFGRLGSLVSYRPRCGMAFTENQGVLQQCDPYD